MKRSGRNLARAIEAETAVRAIRGGQAATGLAQHEANTAPDRQFHRCECDDVRRPDQGLAMLIPVGARFEKLRQAA